MKSDGWNTEPFTLVVDEKTGRLIGRGATDDKGPVLGWINVLQAHHELGLPLPVNLKFCLEGMEESGDLFAPPLWTKNSVSRSLTLPDSFGIGLIGGHSFWAKVL